jgi:hypothetical protein
LHVSADCVGNKRAFIRETYPLINRICMTGADMGDLINLNKFRKRVEKERSEQQAATNRAKFGRTKSEREREEARSERARDLLDQHQIDSGDAS